MKQRGTPPGWATPIAGTMQVVALWVVGRMLTRTGQRAMHGGSR